MGFIKEREADYLLSLFPKKANFYLSTLILKGHAFNNLKIIIKTFKPKNKLF
ncbi:MAG: hypothetical protein CM15mP122_0160 [Bacteroidota bacterium]|nr:MAG: hypothetical protein CM15mP122_0160 [Bacteroidota bacterium]